MENLDFKKEDATNEIEKLIRKQYESLVPDFMIKDKGQDKLMYGKYNHFQAKVIFYGEQLNHLNKQIGQFIEKVNNPDSTQDVTNMLNLYSHRKNRWQFRMLRELTRAYMTSVWHHHRFVDVCNDQIEKTTQLINKYNLPEGDY